MMSRIAKFAQSPQGRKAAAKAKELADKPENKRKIEELRQKVAGAGKGGGASAETSTTPPDTHGTGGPSTAANPSPPETRGGVGPRTDGPKP